MSEGVQIVIDSASPDSIVYSGGSQGRWTTKSGSQWFNNTSASSGTAPGSINVTFIGNAIAFYGHAPPSEESQTMRVTIDKQEPFETTFPVDLAGKYGQWWHSPTLDDGTHTIQLEGLTKTVLDFAAVTLKKSSLHTGQHIIVDDDDASMMYSTNWKQHSPLNSHKGKPVSLPFRNATHKSNMVGSSVSFNFTGSSIAVYGVMPVKTTGSVTARYTLDTNVTTEKHESPEDRKEHHNVLLYSESSLDAGFHTLSIEIEDVQNLTYSLDYMVYKFSAPEIQPSVSSSTKSNTTTSHSRSSSSSTAPTSSTPSRMPTSVHSSSSSSLGMTIDTSSIPVSVVSTSTQTSESQSLSITIATSTPIPERSSDTTAHTGKIIGLTVGSVVILAALIAAMIYRKRRRRHFLPLQEIDHSQPVAIASGSHSSIAIQPFTLSEPAPGSRAASEPMDQKIGSLYSLDASPSFILQQLSGLHRRSWSGTRSNSRASLVDEETRCTPGTSSPTFIGNGKPPSYRE